MDGQTELAGLLAAVVESRVELANGIAREDESVVASEALQGRLYRTRERRDVSRWEASSQEQTGSSFLDGVHKGLAENVAL